jgi:hypothetical protein
MDIVFLIAPSHRLREENVQLRLNRDGKGQGWIQAGLAI